MSARTKKIGLGVVAGVLIILFIAWRVLGHTKAEAGSQADDKTSKHADRVRVHVVHPRKGGIPWSVTRPALVHAFQHVNLYAKVSGFLKDQTVDIGDRVKQGQLLTGIFAPEIVAGVQKAKADLLKAKAMVDVGQARVAEFGSELVEAQARLEEKQADVQSAQALLKLRGEQYHRISELAKMNAIDKELVDEKFEARGAAESAERASVKAVATARAGVAAAHAQVARAQADLANAKAQVQVSQAELDQATALEEYTKIRAPFDGVITTRNFQDGDFIRDASNGASKPVLAVARTDLMRVIVWVPDQAVPNTHKGNSAVLHIDAFDGHEFKGEVARTAMSEDYESRTMRTEIDVPNPDGRLSDGMYGSAKIDLEKSASGMNIPAACLVGTEKENEREVFVVRDGKAHKVKVQVGHNDGIHAQILSGLELTDTVVEQHGHGLDDGVAVEVVSAEKAQAAEKSTHKKDDTSQDQSKSGAEDGTDAQSKDSR